MSSRYSQVFVRASQQDKVSPTPVNGVVDSEKPVQQAEANVLQTNTSNTSPVSALLEGDEHPLSIQRPKADLADASTLPPFIVKASTLGITRQ